MGVRTHCRIRSDVLDDTSSLRDVAREFVAVDAGGAGGGGPLTVAALEDELVGFSVFARVEHVGATLRSQSFRSTVNVLGGRTIRDRI